MKKTDFRKSVEFFTVIYAVCTSIPYVQNRLYLASGDLGHDGVGFQGIFLGGILIFLICYFPYILTKFFRYLFVKQWTYDKIYRYIPIIICICAYVLFTYQYLFVFR